MRSLIAKGIDRQERALGASFDWLREVAHTSLAALFKFTLVGPLGTHRKHLGKEAWHLARIAVTQQEDCGGCVQIVVNMALKDGVAPGLLQAALRGDVGQMAPELAEGYRFAKTISGGGDDPELRDKLRARLGNEAFLELALAIATARLIPTTKRALGYAQSCSLVKIQIGSATAGSHPESTGAGGLSPQSL